MFVSTIKPHAVRFQKNNTSPKSRFQEALEKVTLSDELAQKLETLAKNHNLDAEVVKNTWRQERAFLNMNQNIRVVSDDQLLKEFETRKWDQKIGPRS